MADSSRQATLPAASAVTAVSPTTAPSAVALKGALLKDVDIPGSKEVPIWDQGESQQLENAASCAAFAAEEEAAELNEVEGADLELMMGQTRHMYGSTAMLGSVEEMRASVAAFGDQAAATCLRDMFRSGLESAGLRVLGMTAEATSIEIADGAGLVSVKGSLLVGPREALVGAELLAFRRGTVLVIVSAISFDGDSVGGVAESLARKIEARLPG